MPEVKANKIINGTFGAVWVNKEKWMDIEKFESKVVAKYEEVNMSEDLGTHQKYLGWAGEGTMTVKKVYSRGAMLIGDAVKTGIMPEIEIVGKLADPDAHGHERVAIKEVTIEEFMLLAFEQKTLGTEELPFKYGDFDFIDKIVA